MFVLEVHRRLLGEEGLIVEVRYGLTVTIIDNYLALLESQEDFLFVDKDECLRGLEFRYLNHLIGKYVLDF